MTQTGKDGVQRVGEILDLALERPPHERVAFIAGLCAGDDRLQREATSLLRALNRAGHLLDPITLERLQAGDQSPAPDLGGLVVGPYRIGDRIGAGGMGVVYAAQDTRLGRTVAVKSLPAEWALDPGRREMLEHEAKVLAALSHQNIGAIYGIEDCPHGPILVLEHVAGKTLAEQLTEGPLPIDEARSIARQILLALEAAHAAGVVHRDIKPSNVKLTPSGTVKVLDFGIAKLRADPAPSTRPSSAAVGPMTAPGRLIGTPAYMSPEQARGKSADQRADLWAFGCVLYEMLAGAPAFRGETATDTIAAILRSEPDWTRLSQLVSPAERRLLHRCLEKDPEKRLRNAGDARLELDEPAPDTDPAESGEPRARRIRPIAAAAALSLLIGTVLGALLLGRGTGRPSADPTLIVPTRIAIDLPPDAGLSVIGAAGTLAVSPDGRSIAYVAGAAPLGPRLFVRRLDAFEASALPGTQGASGPSFSPDGAWIAYIGMERGEVRKVRASGGPPITIASLPQGEATGICWGSQETVILSSTEIGALWSIPAAGGNAAPLTELAATEHAHFQPHALLDGTAVLFSCLRFQDDRFRRSIEAVELATGQRRRVLDDACQPQLLPGGHLLYYEGEALKSIDFDTRRLVASGAPRTLISPLAGGEIVPPPRFAVSPAGTLAYLPTSTTYLETEMAWFSLDGSSTTALQGPDVIDSLRLSPDGTRVAYAAGTPQTAIWIHDFARNSRTCVTSGERRFYPVWAPDNRRIAFKTEDSGRIEWMAVDGTSEPETLLTGHPGSHTYPNTFTADGSSLIFTMSEPPGSPEDLFILRLDGDHVPRRIFPTAAHANRFGARMSPDGTMIAYTSEESGTREVYVQPYPALNRRIHVSSGGGFRSAWSGDSKSLFYRFQDRLYGADISTSPELAASTPRLLIQRVPEGRYDAAPEGTRFLVSQAPGGFVPQTRINVVLNWAREAGLDGPDERR